MDVTFYSGGYTLAGTFTEAAEPVAAALLITGSGRSDRNSDVRLPGGRTLRIGVDRAVAGALAAAQVSTLRYDKRGTGASDGDYLACGMDEQVPPADVAAVGQLVRGPFEGHVVGDLSHLLRPDPESAGPRAYRRAVRQPVSLEYLELVTGWVTRRWVPV
jgi:hypothetical protein